MERYQGTYKKDNMKHTPGPWTYAGGDDGTCEINIGDTTSSLCRWEKNTGIYVIERSEMEANAKLVAAAPDLLDALLDMVSDHKELSEATIENARKAIAKATTF